MTSSYLKFANVMLWVAKWLTILIVAAMTISVLIGVFFRYVVPLPMAWPPEAARFMMVAVTMFGSAVAIRQLEHVGITFLVDALPAKARVALYFFGMLLTAAFLMIFLIYSTRMTLEMGPRQYSSSLGVPMSVAFASMPLGAFLMLTQLGAAMIEAGQRIKNGQSPFTPDAPLSSV